MIWFSIFILVALILIIVLPGRNYQIPWKYRSIHCFFLWCEKKDWKIPKWLDEKFIFKLWVTMFAGTVVLFSSSLWFSMESITKFEKPLSGEGTVWEDIEIIWEDEQGNESIEKFQIEIKEQLLTLDEIDKTFQKIKEILDQEILGENISEDFVNKPLYLPEQISDYPAVISWNSSQPWIVNWDGTLGEGVSEEGVEVKLTAIVQIQGEEKTYEWQVKVYPPELTWLDDLKAAVNAVESEDQWIELPNEWNGVTVTWKRDRSQLLIMLTLFVVGSPIFLLLKRKQDAEEEEKRQRQQMLQDYPEIISKLMLLLSAGMNLRRAIERIVLDYRKYYEKNGKRKAYEVLADTCKELNCGVTEKQAYENIGERCELLQYRTLSALLVQHLQKGNRDMEQILNEEVKKAQELRQQQAKIMGEQASAKLLFPMTLMLVDVFIILMIPAWISFSI